MKKLKILWVEDDPNFPGSVKFRIKKFLNDNDIQFDEEFLTNGAFVWDIVRDWKPDIIMMDHNLDDVTINGANLIIEIRFHNNDTPIIFYSSEMDERLAQIAKLDDNIFISSRGDVPDELVRLILNKFL